MVAKHTATVTVEGASGERQMQALTADDVAAAVARLESRRDVTITIQLDNADERLMIGVDGSAAFLGLERADGLFQFATQSEDAGRRDLVIGGQTTSIDRRYLVDVSTAAMVAREWFERGEDSGYGWWERR
jgi:hypothetical protein